MRAHTVLNNIEINDIGEKCFKIKHILKRLSLW